MKVRILPPDTPGIPPPVPHHPVTGYVYDNACYAHSPDDPRIDGGGVGYVCTQPPHGDDVPHACHHRCEDGGHEVIEIIVWGGE